MDSNTPTFDQQRTYSSQTLSSSAQESRYSLDIKILIREYSPTVVK